MFKLFKSKFYIAVILLAGIFLFGIMGYRLLGDYTWVEAAYMTVITITTVGFGEVRPTDDITKIFTIVLITSSVFIVAYAISVVTEYVLSKNALQNIKYRKMKNQIDKLDNHIIICGYGRNGMQAAKKLKAYQKPFVVIEQDEELVNKYSDDIMFVVGNANEDETLLEAGIDRAHCLISALPNDADNLFVVLSSRQLNKEITIISRASQETSQRKLKLAGANKTIMPDKIGGDHMASLVVLPDLIDFMDHLSFDDEHTINLEEVSVDDLPNGYLYKTLIDLDLRKQTGCTVIGYKQPDGKYIINPDATVELLPNSKLVVLGQPGQIKKLNTLFQIPETTFNG
ncbi:potassium channel family protein [Galbibacter pacificus]|uniref:Potassium channel protein n=1 Tax=Galbibacter pacificus TaxID=2996052 RepID=A0ABT6FVR7_9FLAO|nr:potassium channel protein [Galbibacter pacificus]MDG3583745.1 potassium channel protein [Galbibacter pacificus]MDG3587337.1 potassium channel protein [Galbibacter pacificus]